MFDELIEQELNLIEDETNTVFESYALRAYEDDMETLAEDLGESVENATEFYEDMRRHVTSTGNITRSQSRSYRSRRATLTTHMSHSQLKLRARKAARTRKHNPSEMRRAIKKRKKAMKIRRRMGM